MMNCHDQDRQAVVILSAADTLAATTGQPGSVTTKIGKLLSS